jgi:cytochrome P450/ferredoxin-NADP reductase
VTTVLELPEVAGDLTDDAELRAFRDRNWAARSARGIEVFGYDQGMQVLEHPDLLKGPSFQYRLDQLGISGEARRYIDMGITNKEGEERRQMRASYGALFRPTVVARLRASIRAIADELLDEIDDPSQFDLMRLCWEIPARTYCELVSIPHSESHTVIRIADSVLGTLLNVDRSRREEAEAAILESVDIVRHHLDARRSDLGDDFTSVMIRQQEDGLMTEEQLVAQSFSILQASVDNTAHQMGNTFGALLSEPGRWQAYLADRELRAPIIEEVIRLYPRFGTVFRLAAKDVELDDLTIPEGAWTFVSARAGQRDPEYFEAPDEYRLDRPAKRPLMFGAGPYNCLGQNLARMEIEEAMDAVAERFPDLVLTGGWNRHLANAVSETTDLVVDLGRATERPSSAPRHTPATLAAGETVLDCEVDELLPLAVGIVGVGLRAHDGSELPAWEAGSHIDLVLPNGEVRQYSLCGTREQRGRYRVAVLREPDGTGGSSFVHDRLSVGDRVEVRGPRNNFRLEDAPSYRFVAGGIGITAILPMVREAERRGADWSLAYVGRGTERLAFLDEIAALPAERVQILTTARSGRPPITAVTGDASPGALLYACGPAGLLSALPTSGWPVDDIRVERFEPDAAALAAPREAFEVRLTATGATLAVPAEKSILDVVEEAGVAWPYSCREGTCGTCETRIVAGIADHRDAILTPAERARNDYLMICVSRAVSPTLELEI